MTTLSARMVCAALALAATTTVAESAVAKTGVADTPTGERGTVVSAVRVAHMSPAQVRDYLADFHPDFASPKPVNGVDTYRVVYRTISARGRATTASGVVSLPSRTTKSPLRAVSFTHGTHAAKNIAGSVADDGQSRVAAVYYAGAGYAGVAPDYLGLGLGPGFHPYGHAASEASASLDMLRAARAVAESHGRRLRREVFVTGFSQGGQAAMALGRELQRGADRYLRLGALAPVSGPYDVRRAQIPESFQPGTTLNAKTSVFYTAYLMVTWHRLYGLYDSPAEVFQAPYDGTVEKLFDGSGDFEEIGPYLPDSLDDLLTPQFRQRLLHPSGTVLRAMRDMDGTCDWRPQVPTRLYGASSDEQVTYANTSACVRALRARGARPATVDLKTDHFGTLFQGLPAALRWFRSLR